MLFGNKLVFYPRKKYILLLIVIIIIYTIEGRVDNINISFLLSFLCFLIALIFFRFCYSLHLSETGFQIRYLGTKKLMKWSDIDRFDRKIINGKARVVYYYIKGRGEDNKKRERESQGFRILPHNYEKSAEQLAKVLNEWNKVHSETE